MAYIPNLPYPQLSPINEEGTGLTELVTDYSDESYTDSCIYVADVGGGHKDKSYQNTSQQTILLLMLVTRMTPRAMREVQRIASTNNGEKM